MSDIRFACFHCAQHIACDPSYAGNAIDCPACGTRIIVPKNLHLTELGGPMTVALPASSGENDGGIWTEEAWEEHVRRAPGLYSIDDSRQFSVQFKLPQWPVLFAICLPLLVVVGAGPGLMWTAVAVGALLSGYFMSRDLAPHEGDYLKRALMFTVGLIYFGICAEVFLLGGCCWPRQGPPSWLG
jgi:DNA-directed RNA polymerase subunit RPC12/RpoP